MSFEDTITIPKPKKEERRGVITVKAAQASLDRGLKAISQNYGFDLAVDDPRFSIVGSRREGDKAIVTYGMKGRKLDAAALAYELNN